MKQAHCRHNCVCQCACFRNAAESKKLNVPFCVEQRGEFEPTDVGEGWRLFSGPRTCRAQPLPAVYDLRASQYIILRCNILHYNTVMITSYYNISSPAPSSSIRPESIAIHYIVLQWTSSSRMTPCQ